MSSEYLENRIYEQLTGHLSHRPFHLRRLAVVCSAVLLAGTTELSKIARWIRKPIQQPSRVQFLKRFLVSPYFNQEAAYYPLLKEALKGYKTDRWHVIMDRTNLRGYALDLLMASLSFRKRAIPLGWQVTNYGCSKVTSQIQLLKRIKTLIPTQQAVIFHGDTEFGSVELMKFISNELKWDFILGQRSHTYFQDTGHTWHYLGDMPVTKRYPFYQANIKWTKQHQYGPINLFSFFAPRKNGKNSPLVKRHNCVTSLPIAHTLRRLGHRRWGTEPMFRDFKSSGWCIQKSQLHPQLTQNLLVILSINYLFATATGRWLSKSGLRYQVDAKKTSFQFIPTWMGLAYSQTFYWSAFFYSFISLSLIVFTLLFSHITEWR